MNDVCLRDTSIVDDQFQSILLSLDEDDELSLQNCTVTNEMVKEMAKRIKERKKHVRVFSCNCNQHSYSIKFHALFL